MVHYCNTKRAASGILTALLHTNSQAAVKNSASAEQINKTFSNNTVPVSHEQTDRTLRDGGHREGSGRRPIVSLIAFNNTRIVVGRLSR